MGLGTVWQRTPAKEDDAVGTVRDRVPAPEPHLSGFGRRVKVVRVAVQDPADLAARPRLLLQDHELRRHSAHPGEQAGLKTIAEVPWQT